VAFTASAIFQQAMINPLMQSSWTTAVPTTYANLSADVINVALFGNTGTPSKSVTAANSGYNQDQWVTGNETNGGANWPAGGLPLAGKTFTIDTGSSSICFHATNLAGTGNVTVTACYGCLVYDNTITVPAKQGLCYNYFGGTQSVTAGTFTILWATPGGGAVTAVFNVSV
jgi:arabinogalactan endo-1,4-beta-galactosidase